MYEEKLELNLIQGIVPIFNNDMQLTYTIDGLKGNDSFPDKNSIYLAKDVTCDNGITASFDNGTWGLVNISSSSDKIKCNVNFVTPSITNLSSVVKVGDYIKMTPYNLTNVYNIVPSELNLWRVIKINQDETFEVVSQHVSNNQVSFYGQDDYLKLIGTLNYISSLYMTSYTIKSRHMGFNGQIEYLDKEKVLFTNQPQILENPSDNSKEEIGGGDILYQNDVDLINNALGTLLATKKDNSNALYCLASRKYYYSNLSYYSWGVRMINEEGILNHNRVYAYDNEWGGFAAHKFDCSIRPILTIRKNLKAIGDGTSSNPYQI